jgi:molecular chaperone GrpE
LTAEIEELKDQRLRMAAEMENLRRRTARDVKDAKSYAISGFARDMLQVSDNLERALAAVPEQAEGPWTMASRPSSKVSN